MGKVTEAWPLKYKDQALDEALIDAIAKHRKKRGQSIAEAAKRMRITESAICQWEHYKSLPDRLSKWRSLCRATGLRLVIEIYDAGGKRIYPTEAPDR